MAGPWPCSLGQSRRSRDAIFAKLSPCERTHDGADTGIGVLVRIERARDM